MIIYRIRLKWDKKLFPDFGYVEMYFNNRPTNDQIIKHLQNKMDAEIMDAEGRPELAGFCDMIQQYPINDKDAFCFWWDENSQSLTGPKGTTEIHRILVNKIKS